MTKPTDNPELLEALKAMFGEDAEIISLESLRDKLKAKCEPKNPSEIFPSISDVELTDFLTLLSNEGIKGNIKLHEFLEWGAYMGHVCSHNELYQAWVIQQKELIHRANRTIAIGSSFMVGVCIGVWLGRPEWVPFADSGEVEEEKEDV